MVCAWFVHGRAYSQCLDTALLFSIHEFELYLLKWNVSNTNSRILAVYRACSILATEHDSLHHEHSMTNDDVQHIKVWKC